MRKVIAHVVNGVPESFQRRYFESCTELSFPRKIATETPNQGLPRTTAPARPTSAAPLPPAAEAAARDQAEDDDACLTDHGVQPNQVTADSQLPPATGGVAGARP